MYTMFKLILCVVLMPVSLAYATVVQALSDQELVARADRVVLGRVLAVESVMDQVHPGRVLTHAEVVAEQCVKGCTVGERVVYQALGGVVGHRNIRGYVAGAPVFVPGQRLVVFSVKDKDVHKPIGFSYGVFQVQASQKGEQVVRSMAGLTVVGKNTKLLGTASEVSSSGPEKLDVFLSRMRVLASAGKAGGPQP